MKKITLYAKSSTGKPKQWSIWTEEGGYVCKEWGYQGGQLQVTRDLVKQKNVGRSNQTSLDEQAELEAKRAFDDKVEHGYILQLNKINEKKELINWDTAELADFFAPSKPETSISEEDEAALINAGTAIWQKKHNGMCVIVCVGKNSARIYSRRIEDKTDNFKDWANYFKEIYPSGTIIHAELTLDDNPDLIKEVFGAKPEKAYVRLTEFAKKGLFIEFWQFDCLYYKFKDITSSPYLERYEKLKKLERLRVVENFGKKPKIPENWEGLIIRNKYGITHIREDGKPNRASNSWKQKRFETCELVCYEWMTGKGKLNDNVATLKLGAYDSAGKLQHVCESGSGLTDSLREEIKKISPEGKFKNFTVEIKYEEKIEKSGSLRLPILLRLRPDKKPTECLLEDIK